MLNPAAALTGGHYPERLLIWLSQTSLLARLTNADNKTQQLGDETVRSKRMPLNGEREE
jgi:hypothetical protein